MCIRDSLTYGGGNGGGDGLLPAFFLGPLIPVAVFAVAEKHTRPDLFLPIEWSSGGWFGAVPAWQRRRD